MSAGFLRALGLAVLVALSAPPTWSDDSKDNAESEEPGDLVAGTAADGLSKVQVAAAEKLAVPSVLRNRLGMEFVLIPGGSYAMGTPKNSKYFTEFDAAHEVAVDPFYMQRTEVTRAQIAAWRRAVSAEGGAEPPEPAIERPDHPAVHLMLKDMTEFAEWLSKHSNGRSYRLPTEEEWEYACRAGTTTEFYWGDEPGPGVAYENLPPHALGLEQAEGGGERWRKPDAVASYKPNRWGLYDMLGNVSEAMGQRWRTSLMPIRHEKGTFPVVWIDDIQAVRGGSSATLKTGDMRCASRGQWGIVANSGAFSGFRLIVDVPRDD